jgi:hypothetical protein
MISGMEKAGLDHEALLDTYIRAINVCVKDRPADLTVGVHMCRGNFKACLACPVISLSERDPGRNPFYGRSVRSHSRETIQYS